MSIYRESFGPSEHFACPECRGGEFWLLPNGKIICADDDCCADSGRRWVTSEAHAVIADLVLDKVLQERITELAARAPGMPAGTAAWLSTHGLPEREPPTMEEREFQRSMENAQDV